MIQDIAPHIFYNHYKNTKPSKGDCILSFVGKTVAITDFSNTPVRYLFSIDDTKYFLSMEEINAEYAPIGDYKEKTTKFILETAHQIYRWYSHNKFCGQCGTPLEHSDKERMLHCSKCHLQIYPKICPAVIVGVINKDKLLLTRYNGREYKHYSLIAGYNEIGETIEETVHREVMEEVGLKVKNLKFYKSQPWAFSETLLMGFWAELDSDSDITLDRTELEEANWFKAEEIELKNDGISLTHEMITLFKNKSIASLI